MTVLVPARPHPMPPLIEITLCALLLTTAQCLSSLAFTVESSFSKRALNSHTNGRRLPITQTSLFSIPDLPLSSQSDNSAQKRSRSDRKAVERERKQRSQIGSIEETKVSNRRKHNYQQREKLLLSTDSKENSSRNLRAKHSYPLHSRHVSVLNVKSTANDVLIAIKRAQNLHDVHDIRNIEHFLLEEVDESFAFGYRGSILARLAVAALHLNQHDLARRALDARNLHHRASILPLESAAIIRGLLRVHNVTDAFYVLEDELSLPQVHNSLDSVDIRDRIKYRALSLASIVSRHFFEGEPSMAVQACNKLVDMGSTVLQSGLSAADMGMPWTRLIKGAAQCEAGRRNGTVIPCLPNVSLPSNLAYAVLSAMMAFPSDNSDEIYEALSNALVRRSVFVTGAVSMDGCPPEDRGEVVFIGRSNVGKSSLVNMVTNRKSLAYTSKKPGKTQQFNFFAVNDKPGREKEVKFGDTVPGQKDSDSFYLVDVPGFGFAQVPEAQRKQWMEFLSVYTSQRKSLRVVFHLIDSRHGATDYDATIMNQMSRSLSKTVTYVIVLTKADKTLKGSMLAISATDPVSSVSRKILDQVRSTMKSQGIENAPVVLTSAESKLGRDALWSYMRLAADGSMDK